VNDNVKQIAELLKLLANENRLLILCALMKAPLPVNEILKEVPNITQSGLSQHLTLLKAHGILVSAKAGQNIIYSIADYKVNEIINTLKNYYCE